MLTCPRGWAPAIETLSDGGEEEINNGKKRYEDGADLLSKCQRAWSLFTKKKQMTPTLQKQIRQEEMRNQIKIKGNFTEETLEQFSITHSIQKSIPLLRWMENYFFFFKFGVESHQSFFQILCKNERPFDSASSIISRLDPFIFNLSIIFHIFLNPNVPSLDSLHVIWSPILFIYPFFFLFFFVNQFYPFIWFVLEIICLNIHFFVNYLFRGSESVIKKI